MHPAAAVVSLPEELLPPRRPLWWRVGKAVGTVAIAAFMAYALRRMIGTFDREAVEAGFRSMPGWRVAAALGLLALQHVVFIVQESMAVRFAGQGALGLRRVAIASLVSRSLATLGLGTITGFALRLRVYGAWGVGREDVTRLSIYNESTYLVGLIVSAAVVFTLFDVPALETTSIALPSGAFLGVIAGAIVIAYVIASLLRRKPFRIRSFEVPIVRGELLVAQLVLPVVQMIIGGSIVWVCLPAEAGLSLTDTVTASFAASLIGSISQVPGGLGVFEAVILQFAPLATHPAVLAALLVRRVIVNVVPIAVGTVLLVVFELVRRPRQHTWVWTHNVASALSVAVFVGGVLLVVMASAGTIRGPFGRLGDFAHTVLFAIGFATLIVSHGLHHRMAPAWRAAVFLLALRFVIALAAGPDVPALLGSLALLILLASSKAAFVERVHAAEDPLAWYATVAVALIGVGWVAIAAEGGDVLRGIELRGAGVLIAGAALLAGAGVRRARARRVSAADPPPPS